MSLQLIREGVHVRGLGGVYNYPRECTAIYSINYSNRFFYPVYEVYRHHCTPNVLLLLGKIYGLQAYCL